MNRGLQRNLRKATHVSWHITGLCLGLILGVAVSAITAVHSFGTTPLLVVGALIIAILAFSKRTRRFTYIALCAGLLLGTWRGSVEQQALKAYNPFFDTFVTVRGVVAEDVSHGDKGDTRMQLTHVRVNGKPLHGKVWTSTTIDDKMIVKRSDTIILQGKLGEGFGSTSASMSPATFIKNYPTSENDYALQARDWFADGIRNAIPEPGASLGSGFLVGQHSDLPGNLSDELKAVGLTHAVVASGSNLTILVGATRRLFGKLSTFTATMAGAGMTAGFILVTGLSPSMTRAGLVTGLSLLAWYYGRRIHPMTLLPFAAAITVAINPTYVWGDIGWYLSFGAFAGVLILAPLLQHYFWGKDYKPNIITEILIGTTAAQIATMPIILFSFGTYSSYALLANILVLPFVPFAMLLTFVAGIFGIMLPGSIAGIVGIPADLVMTYMLKIIHWVANLPGATGEITFATVALVASYATMIGAILYMWWRTKHVFGQEMKLLIGDRP